MSITVTPSALGSFERALGDRKIDVVVLGPATVLEPVHQVARAEGVVLRA